MNIYYFKIYTTAFTTAQLATDAQECLNLGSTSQPSGAPSGTPTLAPSQRPSPLPTRFPTPAGGPFTLVGSKSPAKRVIRPGTFFKVTFALTRTASGDPADRRQLLGLNKITIWESYDVLITMPGQGTTLKGKPRVTPLIPKRKGANVANRTMIAWNQVPMRVEDGTHKNYTREFSFAVKVDKTFLGNLTFAAAATGPQQGWLRETTLTVPVARK